MEEDPGRAAAPTAMDDSSEKADERSLLEGVSSCQASSPPETTAAMETNELEEWKEMAGRLSRACEMVREGALKDLERLKQRTEENYEAALGQIKATTATWHALIEEKEAELCRTVEETRTHKLKAMTEREAWFSQLIDSAEKLESSESSPRVLLDEGASLLSHLSSPTSPHHSHITAHPGLGFCSNINDSLIQMLSLGMWVSGEDVKVGEKLSISAVGGLQPNGTFWVRRVTSDPWRQEYALQHISNSLFEVPQSSQPLEEVSLGQLCVGQFSQDGRWYRAVVTHLPRPGMAKYFFLDHGGNEEASVSSLYPLPDHFRAFPFQMIHVRLTSDLSINFNTREMRWRFTDFTHKKQLVADILGEREVDEAGPVYLICLTDHTQEEPFDVGQMLVMAAQMKESTSKFKSRDVRFKDQRETVTTSATMTMPISSQQQQQQQQQEQRDVQQTVEKVDEEDSTSTSSNPLQTSSGGESKEKEREEEREEKVKEEEREKEGDAIDRVSHEQTGLEDCPPSTQPFSTIDPLHPPQSPSHSPLYHTNDGPNSIPQHHQIISSPNSIPLNNTSPHSTPPDEKIDSMSALVNDRDMKPAPLQLGPELEGVLENNVAPGNGGEEDEVTDCGAERLHPTVKIGERLAVEVVTDLSVSGDFWCQLLLASGEAGCYDTLQDDLQKEMGRAESDAFTPVFYHEGELCTARFSEDDNWYRGRIERVSPGAPHMKFTVRYIDFGNSEERQQHQLKPLGSKFKLLPLRAVHCNMSTAEHITFSQTECEKFIDLTSREGIAVEVLSVGEDVMQPVGVRLLETSSDGEYTDISQLLISSSEKQPPKRQWSSSNDLMTQNVAHVTDWASHMEQDDEPDDAVFLTLPGHETSRETTPLAREATPTSNAMQREATPTFSDSRTKSATPTLSSTEKSSISMTTAKPQREATPTISAPVQQDMSTAKQMVTMAMTTNKLQSQQEATPTLQQTLSPLTSRAAATKSGQCEATPTQQEATPTQWVPLSQKSSNFLQRVPPSSKDPQRSTGPVVRQARLDLSRAKHSIISSLSAKPLPRPGRHDDDGLRRSRHLTASGKLYVKCAPDLMSDTKLRELFGRYGDIINVDPHTTDSSVVYLTMDIKGAEEAVNQLNGYKVSPGHTLTVEKYRNPSPSPPPPISFSTSTTSTSSSSSSSVSVDLSRVDHMRLFVKNVSGDQSLSNLKTVFSRFGTVLKLFPDPKRKSVTYIYMDVEGGTKAINNLHGKAISKNGKPLVVELSHEPKNR